MIQQDAQQRNAYNSPVKPTHTIVSQMAYLTGVPKRIFENEYDSAQIEVYNNLEKNKMARIIRNLCRLRTAFEEGYKEIWKRMTMDYQSISSMSDLIPYECLKELLDDGIPIQKNNCTANQYIININRLISDRINNCKGVFSNWVEWEYIKKLFIMPDGFTEAGISEAAKVYYAHRLWYPYQVYINWTPSDEGNIFHSDPKFMTLLYKWNGDTFRDFHRVTDASDNTRESIYMFLEDSQKVIMAVDCENADPFKLCSTLRGLDHERLSSITKIVLYDDIHASTAWQSLESYINIPIERILVERVHQGKSLVDPSLIGGIYREFYKNEIDSFILVSSDSDYWALITGLPEARWLVMIESEKCGPTMKQALQGANIFYCYMDDFDPAQSAEFVNLVIVRQANETLKEQVSINLRALLQTIYHSMRVTVSEAEEKQFYAKYLKMLKLEVSPDGDIQLALRR